MPDTKTIEVEDLHALPASAIEADRNPAAAELKARAEPRGLESEARKSPQATAIEPAATPPHLKSAPEPRRRRALPFLVTAIAVAVAGMLGTAMWNAHMGDLLMVIDQTNYKIAVSLAEASAQQALVNAQNTGKQSWRRQQLSTLAVTVEEQQNFQTNAIATQAQYQQAQANLAQARVNFQRTEIRSPVNGWVTNLLTQRGDYVNVGSTVVSLVDADSFWIDGYFEETSVARIREGDPSVVRLMGYSQTVRGHVGSIARGINVANAQPNGQGLANVNPIFTWVRLAQRIPVRIHIDEVPEGVALAAGMTATVQIDPRPRQPAK